MNNFTTEQGRRRTLRRLGTAFAATAASIALVGAAATPAQAATVRYRPYAVQAFDINDDGTIDSLAADINHDGYYDTYGLLSRTGRIFAVGMDQNENGRLDTVVADFNLNGRVDRVMYDLNEDGVWDSAYSDASERGYWIPVSLVKVESNPNIVTLQENGFDLGPDEENPILTFLRDHPGATSIPGVTGVLNSAVYWNTWIDRTHTIPGGSVLVGRPPTY